MGFAYEILLGLIAVACIYAVLRPIVIVLGACTGIFPGAGKLRLLGKQKAGREEYVFVYEAYNQKLMRKRLFYLLKKCDGDTIRVHILGTVNYSVHTLNELLKFARLESFDHLSFYFDDEKVKLSCRSEYDDHHKLVKVHLFAEGITDPNFDLEDFLKKYAAKSKQKSPVSKPAEVTPNKTERKETAKKESVKQPLKQANSGDGKSPDDADFIRELKHSNYGAWQEYSVLLATNGYGWDTMKDWADYMVEADLTNVSEVTTGFNGELNVTESYLRNGSKCEDTPELDEEMSSLSVAGHSRALNTLMKIGWFNQTCVLKFITPEKDEAAIRKYIEAMIRRTFGSKDAIKPDREAGASTSADTTRRKPPKSAPSTRQPETKSKPYDISEDIISEERNGDTYTKKSTISYRSVRIRKEISVAGAKAEYTYYAPISMNTLTTLFSDHIMDITDDSGADAWGNAIICSMQEVTILTEDYGLTEHFYDLVIVHACEYEHL